MEDETGKIDVVEHLLQLLVRDPKGQSSGPFDCLNLSTGTIEESGFRKHVYGNSLS